MRVLYCHTSRPGGAELAAPALAQQLEADLWVRGQGVIVDKARERGLRLRVLSPRTDKRSHGFSAFIGIVVELLAIQFEMVKLLRREPASIVISNTVQGLLHLAIPCALTRTPLVVYVRDLGAGGNRPYLEVFLYRLLLRLFSRGHIFNSALTKESWGTLKKDVVVIPTAVPPEFYDVWQGQVSGSGVMLGRIADWKGQRQAVQALEKVSQAHHTIRLDLVGGKLFGETVALPDHGFPLKVTDHVDDPWNYLRNVGFLVHASLTPEPFGQVVAQAAAAGVPIICSHEGGQMEWLRDGESCLAVDPTDTEAFARAITNLLDLPDDAKRRAKKARQAAESFKESTAYAGLRKWLENLEQAI